MDWQCLRKDFVKLSTAVTGMEMTGGYGYRFGETCFELGRDKALYLRTHLACMSFRIHSFEHEMEYDACKGLREVPIFPPQTSQANVWLVYTSICPHAVSSYHDILLTMGKLLTEYIDIVPLQRHTNNWDSWLIDIKALLRRHDLWHYMEVKTNTDHWRQKSMEAADLVTPFISSEIKEVIDRDLFDDGYQLLQHLHQKIQSAVGENGVFVDPWAESADPPDDMGLQDRGTRDSSELSDPQEEAVLETR